VSQLRRNAVVTGRIGPKAIARTMANGGITNGFSEMIRRFLSRSSTTSAMPLTSAPSRVTLTSGFSRRLRIQSDRRGRGLWKITLPPSGLKTRSLVLQTSSAQRERIVPGDLTRATSILSGGAHADLHIVNAPRGIAFAGSPGEVRGGGWAVGGRTGSLAVTLDGKQVDAKDWRLTPDGEVIGGLPALTQPGPHVLKIIESLEGKPEKSATLEFHVVMDDKARERERVQ